MRRNQPAELVRSTSRDSRELSCRWGGRLFRCCLLLVCWVLSAGGPSSAADDSPKATPDPGAAASPEQPTTSDRVYAPTGIRLQETDAVVEPLVPAHGRTAADERRIRALTWFTVGQVHERRAELKKAFEAYKRADALDPGSKATLRSLTLLAEQIPDQQTEALTYGQRYLELDPRDSEILRIVAIRLAEQNEGMEAIRLLEQAAESPTLPKKSPLRVFLLVDLANYYVKIANWEKAADCYEVLFDAATKPADYRLAASQANVLMQELLQKLDPLITILLQAKRVKTAGTALDLATKSGRVGKNNLHYLRSKWLQVSGKNDAAFEELQKYLDRQAQSKGRDAYQLLAEILRGLGRADEVVGRLEKLAEDDPHNRELHYFLADQLVAVGDLERAKSIYERMLKGAKDAAGYLGLASIHRRLNQAGELLTTLGRALAKVGPEGLEKLDAEIQAIANDEPLTKSLFAQARERANQDANPLTFEESYVLATVAVKADRVDDAVEFYNLALRLGQEVLPRLYREAGLFLIRARRYQLAADLYQRATEDNRVIGERIQYLYFLANAREMNGETDLALKAIDEAISFLPNNSLLRMQRGWILSHSRQWNEAISHFEGMIRDFSDDKEVVRDCQYGISNIYVQQGEMRRGEEILEKILEEIPDDARCNNDLGYLYAEQGKNLDQAEKMIRKAVAKEPDNAAYQDSLGWVLFKLGRYEEALGPLQKATSTSTSSGGDSTLWDHLGDVQHQLKQTNQAVESWRKALNHAEADKHADPQLLGRLRDKLMQHAPAGTP